MSASPGQPANMVRLADSGVLIWLIIFVMVSLAKGWSKLQESKESQSPEPDDDAPPPAPPTPPVPRPQPRPVTVPMPRVPRAVPPAIRRPTPQSAPAPTPAARKVSADDIRRVVEKMGRKPQPTAPMPLPSHSVPSRTRRHGRTAPAAATSFALGGTRSEADDCGRSATRAILARVTMDRSTPRPGTTSGTSLLPTKSSVRPGPSWSSGSRNANPFHPIP